MAKMQGQASSSVVQSPAIVQPKKLAKEMAEAALPLVSEAAASGDEQIETQELVGMSDEEIPDDHEDGVEEKAETGDNSEEKDDLTEPSQTTGISQEEALDVLSATI